MDYGKGYIVNLIESYISEIERLDESLKTAREYFFKRSDDEDMFNQLSELDPTPTKKYLDWITRQIFLTPLDHSQFIQKLQQLIPQFDEAVNHNKISPKDINQYKSIEDIESAIDNIKPSNKEKNRTHRNNILTNDVEIRYEDDNYILYLVKSKPGIDIIGLNTKWCLTYKNDPSYWLQYVYEDNELPYVLVNKHLPERDPMKKNAFMVHYYGSAISQILVYNTKDDEMSYEMAIGYDDAIPNDLENYFSPDDRNILNNFDRQYYSMYESLISDVYSKDIISKNDLSTISIKNDTTVTLGDNANLYGKIIGDLNIQLAKGVKFSVDHQLIYNSIIKAINMPKRYIRSFDITDTTIQININRHISKISTIIDNSYYQIGEQYIINMLHKNEFIAGPRVTRYDNMLQELLSEYHNILSITSMNYPKTEISIPFSISVSKSILYEGYVLDNAIKEIINHIIQYEPISVQNKKDIKEYKHGMSPDCLLRDDILFVYDIIHAPNIAVIHGAILVLDYIAKHESMFTTILNSHIAKYMETS